jgi:hypothetical protein
MKPEMILAEPFPWTVTQGAILVFMSFSNQLIVLTWILSMQANPLESCRV